MALFIATFESRSFTFEGVGTSAREATRALFAGLRAHGRQYDLPQRWWIWQSEPRQSNAQWFEENACLRRVVAGEAYRDHQESNLLRG